MGPDEHGWETIRSRKAESWPGRIIRRRGEKILTAEGAAEYAEGDLTEVFMNFVLHRA
jgi:hypothetical protein